MKNTVRKKILRYRQIYVDLSDLIVFMSVSVNTSGRLYNDFLCLFLFHVHREASGLTGDLSEESDPFRFLHST